MLAPVLIRLLPAAPERTPFRYNGVAALIVRVAPTDAFGDMATVPATVKSLPAVIQSPRRATLRAVGRYWLPPALMVPPFGCKAALARVPVLVLPKAKL